MLKVTKADLSRLAMQQHGLTRYTALFDLIQLGLPVSDAIALWFDRTLASNMVVGVSDGFSKIIELVGTGYRATVAGQELTLNVGYCKPRVLPIPDGLKVTVRTSRAD